MYPKLCSKKGFLFNKNLQEHYNKEYANSGYSLESAFLETSLHDGWEAVGGDMLFYFPSVANTELADFSSFPYNLKINKKGEIIIGARLKVVEIDYVIDSDENGDFKRDFYYLSNQEQLNFASFKIVKFKQLKGDSWIFDNKEEWVTKIKEYQSELQKLYQKYDHL